MSVIQTKSISGITSITTPSGSDNLLTIHTSDTTERFRIDNLGNTKVGSGVTLSPDGNLYATGIITATTGSYSGTITANAFAGDGSALTGVANTNVIFTDKLSLGDSEYINVGLGSDLKVYHDGTRSYVNNSTGELFFEGNSGEIALIKGTYASGEWMLRAKPDAEVALYHNNALKAQTHADGFRCFTDCTIMGGEGENATVSFKADDGDDNADNWKITASPSASQIAFQNYESGSWENSLILDGGAGAKLYHNNVLKAETTSDGITMDRNSADTTITDVSQLILKNTNNGGNTLCGIRFEVGSSASTDHFIAQKKHSSGNGTDLIIQHGSNERIRFIESGGFTFGGDTASANALDDYEQGTFTPIFDYDNSASGIVHTQQQGQYTKIGNTCWFQLRISLSNSGSGNGNAKVRGLPFTPYTSSVQHTMQTVHPTSGINLNGSEYMIFCQIQSNYFYLYRYDCGGSSGGSYANLGASEFDTSAVFNMEGFFFTAAP